MLHLVRVAIHLPARHAGGPPVALDDDIDGRDDRMVGIEGRHPLAAIPAPIDAYRGLAGDEGAALRGAAIGARGDMADRAWFPAMSRLDQQVAFRVAVAANLAERRPNTGCAFCCLKF